MTQNVRCGACCSTEKNYTGKDIKGISRMKRYQKDIKEKARDAYQTASWM